jgi:hypothetical protein
MSRAHDPAMDEPDRAIALLAKQQYGVFHRTQAEAAGLDRWGLSRRIRSGRLERVGPLTYRFPGQVPSWRQLLTAGLLDLGEGAVVGGLAAAALHRFDGFAEGPVEFLVPRELKDRRSIGVVRSTSALPLIDCCTRERRFRATSPAATIVRMAAHVPEAELKRAVDSAIRDGGTSEIFSAAACRLSVDGGDAEYASSTRSWTVRVGIRSSSGGFWSSLPRRSSRDRSRR